MKRSVAMFLLLAGLLLCVTGLTAQSTKSVSGYWTFSIQTGSGTLTAQATINGDTVLEGTMNTASGQLSIFGVSDATTVKIYVRGAAGEVPLVLSGTRGDESMSGTVQSTGEDVGTWSARRN